MTILELREKRAKAWDAAKAFLDSHRTDKGTLSAEDDATYSRMEQDISDLGKEIARMERREALDAELNKPVSQPITGKPAGDQQAEKKGRASDEYKRNFWNAMRLQGNPYEIRNALQEGTDSEGGYLVPDEYERTLVQALEEENVFRRLAKVIQTSSGDRKIPIVTSHGSAAWLDEEDALTESDEVFGQTSLSAYKLGTFLKVSDELLNDSVFDLPSYISTEFARRIGAKEEEAFFVGDGSGKPTGIFAATGGAQTGVTAASSRDANRPRSKSHPVSARSTRRLPAADRPASHGFLLSGPPPANHCRADRRLHCRVRRENSCRRTDSQNRSDPSPCRERPENPDCRNPLWIGSHIPYRAYRGTTASGWFLCPETVLPYSPRCIGTPQAV